MKKYSGNGASMPSQLPDHVTALLDESFERGVKLGRNAGLSAAADFVRNLPYSETNITIIRELEHMKHA